MMAAKGKDLSAARKTPCTMSTVSSYRYQVAGFVVPRSLL